MVLKDRRIPRFRHFAALTAGSLVWSSLVLDPGEPSLGANKPGTAKPAGTAPANPGTAVAKARAGTQASVAGPAAGAADPAARGKGKTSSAPLRHVPGRTIDSLVAGWLKRPDLQHSQIGVEVMELPSGRILYSLNGNRRFTTASTAKVLTTACAFDTFGPNFTYKTELRASGSVDDGKVHGNLIICPSQDPTFSREDLQRLFSELSNRKIKQIEGHVEIEPIAGGSEYFSTGWLPEDWGQTWMPVCSSLVIDRNIAPGVVPLKGAKIVQVSPEATDNALFAGLMNSDEAAAWLSYDAGKKELRVCPGKGTTVKSPLAVANPDDYNLLLAESMLQDMGIKEQTPVVKEALGVVKRALKPHGNTRSDTTAIAEHLSKPLSAIIQTCLHESDNLYAQQLLRTLGLLGQDEANKLTPNKFKEMPPIEERGLYRLTNWLSKIGAPAQEVVLTDGCGLSRKDNISPHALNCVLSHMAGPTLNGPYLSLLKQTGGGHPYRYKTGSMESVSSIAG
ncbi:MAG TPA: D-alanyl-D-alanine carboxypeptidase/D-alanyl-D-alanine-endopeptidase, partial [Chroococcales cyanobacterium]